MENLNEARAALIRLYTSLRDIDIVDAEVIKNYSDQFNAVMDDDFNTPRAIAVMHEIAHELNRQDDKTSGYSKSLAATLIYLGKIFGLLEANPENYLKSKTGTAMVKLDYGQIEEYIKQRNEARKQKDFQEADRIRNLLQDNGISLEDTTSGTVWYRS